MRDGTVRDVFTLDEARPVPAQGPTGASSTRMRARGCAWRVGGRQRRRASDGFGERHYGRIRDTAVDWLGRVEIDASRIDDAPRTFSGGMPSGSRSPATS